MCAIIGVASPTAKGYPEWLVTGRDAMTHRGPDSAGLWNSPDGLVALAHRRLAVLDLSLAGRQPMVDPRGEVAVVFNGEIYNYSALRRDLAGRGYIFRSSSDTEVILAAYREWGERCISQLHGMFAFALYDSSIQTLLLARDRAGEKPLFYWFEDGELRFASELKGLISGPNFPRSIDYNALDCYLAMGFVPGERCIVRGIRKLPAAHALSFNLTIGNTRLWRYWTLPPMPAQSAYSHIVEQELVSELENLLEDSVRRQLIADVPKGVLLSGGVDSSLVTAMAARTSGRVNTFTVAFPAFGAYDESAHASRISRHFDTAHTVLEVENVGPDLLLMLARQYDEPVIDSSMIPTYLVSRLVRQHCTVVLGGDGGDELFGGYSQYSRLLDLRERFGWLPHKTRKLLGAVVGSLLPTGFRGRNALRTIAFDLYREFPVVAPHFDARERAALSRQLSAPPSVICAEDVFRARVPEGSSLLDRAMRMDFENYLAEDILVKVDRASMLTSLEVRSPFLDHRIVEFAFGRVPEELKATAKDRKIILKKLASRILPSTFDLKRKKGFSVPLPKWLKSGAWRETVHDILLDRACMFDRRSVHALLNGQDYGRANSERIFGLVLLELWRREYGISA